MTDFDDIGAYYADKEFFEREYPELAARKQEKELGEWLEDEFYELED